MRNSLSKSRRKIVPDFWTSNGERSVTHLCVDPLNNGSASGRRPELSSTRCRGKADEVRDVWRA